MKKDIKWSVDQSHSHIEFKIRHLMIANVKGTFKNFDASIYTTAKDFTTAEVDLWIDAASITTGDDKRDEHLKSVDFLEVENHKQITFKSSTMQKADATGNQELWGELTIRGITKNIKLNVRFGGITIDPWGNEKAGFEVTGKIDRTQFGLVWNAPLDAGTLLVSDEVSISCEFELINMGIDNLKMSLEPEEDHKATFQK